MKIKRNILVLGIGFLLFLLFLFELFSVMREAPWVVAFDTFWIENIRADIDPAWGNILAFLTHLGSMEFVVLMTLLIVAILLYRKKFVLGLWFLGTIGLGAILLKLLKSSVARVRPGADDWLISASGFSYPSGHSFASSIFYGLLGLCFIMISKNLPLRVFVGILCLLIVLLMMYARVYLGVHFPSDVLGGFLLGNSLAFLSVGFYFLFFKKI
ncbi:phosphatase PAP2 family protein [Helicobacter sp. 11S02596-1]|uniref:phosphatase PAP2 family protein n=1 Tax=Helicobacter sp. 11S02596-1 TaxID=1476194 RepID=UPI000BA6D798|nr:phosphatase PAP2 family protein [Helicobacter sp. 11S02596-1]PAF44270.1 hypothetical protein BJI48_03580 [Helicobacter sp. 11S02596-1]